MKKIIILTVVFFFVMMSFTPIPGVQIKNQIIKSYDKGNILYVGGSGPGNYTSIQDAIDNASDSDTIFVYDDSSPYEESIVVDKSINLIGENRNTTFINGSSWGKGIVYINADWTNFSGFTIQNIGEFNSGIYLNSNFSTITGNNLLDYRYWSDYYMFGIRLHRSNFNTIDCNKISLVSRVVSGLGGSVGVYISNSNNNIIKGNNISKNYHENGGYGVYISNSYNNIISGNILSKNSGFYEGGGIYLYNSTKNNINNNLIFLNKNGIYIYKSNNNFIINNNKISDNSNDGIHLYSSYDNSILGNSFFNDGLFVEHSKNNHVENNLINDKPLVYLEEKSDKVITEAGQVILLNCNNITMEKQNITNVRIGLELWKTNNCNIRNNNFSKVDYSIYSRFSNNNNLSNNNFSNTYRGFDLYASNVTTIFSNNLSDGRIFIKKSKDNIVSNNKISTDYDGITLLDCYKSIISNNNINLDNDNKGLVIDGVYLGLADESKITNNNIDLNGSLGSGILISSSDNNIISHNNISNIGYEGNDYGWGIKSLRSDSNTIILNNITKSWRGISIDYYSKKNKIIANNIMENRGDGLHFKQSIENMIFRNTIKNNEFGISLYDSSHNNTIYHNNLINNSQNAYDKCNNTWDDDYPSGGNYWDDYNGTDNDGDGIGDTPYPIPGGNNEDRYPLMEPYVNHPPAAPFINGSTQGKPGIDYNYTFVTTDPEGDDVLYYISWGDKEKIYIYGPYTSGEEITLSYNWSEKGTYIISCWGRDIYDAVSNVSKLEVTIPKDKAVTGNILLQRFLDRFPLFQRLLDIWRSFTY